MTSEKEKRFALSMAIILLVVGVICYAYTASTAKPPEEPVRVMFKAPAGPVLFNHKTHTEAGDYGISCKDCHHKHFDAAEEDINIKACGKCHQPPKGVLVTEVTPNGPAGNAGIEPNDIILKLNGENLSDSESLIELSEKIKAGDKANVLVLRDGNKSLFELQVTSVSNNAKPRGELGASVSDNVIAAACINCHKNEDIGVGIEDIGETEVAKIMGTTHERSIELCISCHLEIGSGPGKGSDECIKCHSK